MRSVQEGDDMRSMATLTGALLLAFSLYGDWASRERLTRGQRFSTSTTYTRSLHEKRCTWPSPSRRRVSLPGAATLPDIQLLSFDEAVDKDWQGRGGFGWSHLVPPCSDYPDWGATREYRFRGMRLTTSISGVILRVMEHPGPDSPYFRLQGLTAHLSAIPDPTAVAAVGGV